MNIQELAKQALERINSMSAEELGEKFVEHGYGYVPVQLESPYHVTYSNKQIVVVRSVDMKHYPISEVKVANQPTFFTLENHNIDLAA
ncbi:hypothetical protein Q9L42_004660 [Methylomarinum sp. Ch1-1]|uniref:Phage protein n=1 Tax=Methylomarinum roseum TaxID=3067653 RepID=A0AAU7NWM0_9GAMM|nr:hypothetical protein [Methylomarinum sp. Ch1-1]MDP4522510.1 hypothetical protein [Methylomarinum sp. Ch1-1]